MALEDCEILALLLAHHQDRDQDGWRLAAKLYSDMRIPRLLWIRQEADKRSGMKQDMGVLQEMVMYFFIWLGCEYALLRYRECDLTDTYCAGKTGLAAKQYQKFGSYDVPAEVEKVLTKHL